MKPVLLLFLLSLLACNSNVKQESDSRKKDESVTSSQNNVEMKKCDDMESYDFGYAVAKDQDGLLADCNYLYDAAITQKNITSKSCFCAGVSAYRNNK